MCKNCRLGKPCPECFGDAVQKLTKLGIISGRCVFSSEEMVDWGHFIGACKSGNLESEASVINAMVVTGLLSTTAEGNYSVITGDRSLNPSILGKDTYFKDVDDATAYGKLKKNSNSALPVEVHHIAEVIIIKSS